MAKAYDAVDIDQIVNYKAEYTAVIKNYKITDGGRGLVGLCPFHEDRQSSFSADFDTGKWHCFSEGTGGNFVSFWAKLYGVSTKDAYKEILEKYHAGKQEPEQADAERKKSELSSYSLEQYSADKHLPAEFLAETCRIRTARTNAGTTYLRIPYFLEGGSEAVYRKRFAGKEFRWQYGAAGKICLYGEWRLPGIRKEGFAILVEGESDTQSLWYMGFPALGVPGASMFRASQAAVLKGVGRLYLHVEPDKGGETFLAKVRAGLRDGGFSGTALTWSCRRFGVKDPSDLYLKHGKEEAARLIRDAIGEAKEVDLFAEDLPEPMDGAPIGLRQPEGWLFSDRGISSVNEKQPAPTNVCRTPILLTRRLKSIETGEEKIEVAFKRDGRWHTATYPRSTIFSSRSVTALADLGCTVTSENAKQVVRFLGALEAENIDLIPKVDATSTFGWQPGNRFLPGQCEGLALDIDPSQAHLAAAYCQAGTFADWLKSMAPHRQRDRFRFILAASFAAPLLRILKHRTFFVYNWGSSKGGKTAALKAALSAWGDPERLMVSFNATQVGLERTASFYSDLPLGIDERQLAGSNQEALEKTVYMIGNGAGKIRGAKGGGLQVTRQWRTVAIATGEEPIASETSQTGVRTRVLEIYGGPFDNEQDASRMHRQSMTDFGWAGPAFIERLVKCDERTIQEAFGNLEAAIKEAGDGRNGSHVSGIAAVSIADAMIDSWFFCEDGSDDIPETWFLRELGIRESSWQRAKEMAAAILAEQKENNSTDVNENAVQFVTDWVASNLEHFESRAPGGTRLGMLSDDGNVAYIFQSILTQALTKAGFSARKTMKYMAEQELISSRVETDGKKTYSTIKRFGAQRCRFVEFFFAKASGGSAPAKEEAPAQKEPENQQLSFPSEFMEAPPDVELPF